MGWVSKKTGEVLSNDQMSALEKHGIAKPAEVNKPEEKNAFVEYGVKPAAGVALGAAESFNIPKLLELLPGVKRGALPDVGEYISGARAGGEYLANKIVGVDENKTLSDIYKETQAGQKAFEEQPLVKYPKLGTEVGIGLYNLVSLAKKAPTIAKGAKGLYGAIKGSLTGGKSVEGVLVDAKKAKELLQEITGNVPEEVGVAITERPDQVINILKTGKQGESLLPKVEAIRNHLNETKKFLGEKIGVFRDAILSMDTKKNFNAKEAIKMLDDLISSKTYSAGGTNIPIPDLKYIEGLRQTLMRGKMTPKDAFLMVEDMDNKLRKFYNSSGQVQSNVSRQAEFVVSGIRNMMKEKLHEMFPQYKEIDKAYSAYKDSEALIGSRIEGVGAESFLSNIFGTNKNEIRGEIEKALDLGEKARKSLSSGMENIKSFAKTRGDIQNLVVEYMKEESQRAKFPMAKKFYDEVSNVLAARKISSASKAGFGDEAADRIRTIIDRTAKEYQSAYGAAGALAGTAVGTVAGYLMKFFGGDPSMRNIMSMGGGGIGAMVGKPVLSHLGLKTGTAIGKKIADAEYLLGVLARAGKQSEDPSRWAKIIDDAKYIKKVVGDDAVGAFLNMIPISLLGKKGMDYLSSELGDKKPEKGIHIDVEYGPRRK